MESSGRERWQQIESLFDLVSAAPAEDREAILERECRGDAALRREVLSLLRVECDVSGFLETPLGPTLGSGAGRRLQEGERLDVYRLERQIGAGGMGEVWLARRDDGQFDQIVAIKFVRTGVAFEDVVERFRHERQLLAGLEHANVARLLGGGTHQGLPYLVMEYVDGKTLDVYCHDRGLGVTARIELFLQVCDAVHAAHRQLIVHRDLKPSNVLVNREGQVKLLDFGIAKLLDTGESRARDMTVEHRRALTPRYASPEQVLDQPITTASDVYTLGVMLYELMTGASPYGEETRARHEQEKAVLHTPVRVPSDASHPAGRRNVRRLRGDLDNIVMTALRREPDRRYPSVEALAGDLRRHLKHEPVSARPDTWSYRTGRFLRRHPVPAALAAAFVLALVTGLMASLILYRNAEDARATAERERRKANAERNIARQERENADRARTKADAERQRAVEARDGANAARDRAEAAEREARRQALIANLAAANLEIDRDRVMHAFGFLDAVHTEDRDWMWKHLYASLDQSIGQVDPGRLSWSVGVDAGGDTIFFGTQDNEVVFLRCEDRAELARIALDIDTAKPHRMKMSNDRAYAMFAYEMPPVVFVVDIDARSVVERLDVDLDYIRSIDVSDDGSRIVVAGGRGLRLIDRASGDIRLRTGEKLELVAFNHTNDAILLAHHADQWKLSRMDAASGEVDATLEVGFRVDDFVQAGDGTVVAAGGDGNLVFWEPEKNASRNVRLGEAEIRTLTPIPGRKVIAVGCGLGSIQLIDSDTGEVQARLRGHRSMVHSIVPDADDGRLWSTSIDRTIRHWDVRSDLIFPSVYRQFPVGIGRFALSPCGTRIALTERDGTLVMLDAMTHEVLARMPQQRASDVVYAPDGTELIVAKDDGGVVALFADTLHESRSLVPAREDAAAALLDVAARADGRSVLAIARDADATLLDLSTGRPITAFVGHSATIRVIDLDDAGKRVATGTRNGEVRVWSTDTGEVIWDLPRHDLATPSLAFRPGHDELITGSFRPAYVRVFDLSTGNEKARSRDLGSLMRLAVSPDGRRVIVVGTSRSGIMLDASTARMLAPFESDPKLFPTQIEFTADGSTLLCSGNEWTVGEKWRGTLDRWTIHSNQEQERDRQAILSRAAMAREICDRYQETHVRPEDIAAAIRAATSLDPATRQAALNEILRRLR